MKGSLLRFTRLAALIGVTLIACALALVACGGGDDGGGEDVGKVLDETFQRNDRVKSGELNVNLRAELEGIAQLNDPVTIKVGGPFQNQGEDRVPKLDLDISANAGGQSFTAGAVSTGEKGYVKFQGRNYVLPNNVFAQFERELKRAQAEERDQPTLGALGVDPSKWLENPTDEGTEDVGGEETIHIAADIEMSKLLADLDGLLSKASQLGLSQQQQQQLPNSLTPRVRKQIEQSVKEAKVDVYTGKDDRILRKLDVKLDFDVPKDLRDQASGLKSGNVEFSVEITEVNEPQKISPPKNARPLKELQDLLGSGGLGGLGSGSGANGAGGTTGSGGASGSGEGSSQTAPPVDSDQMRRYLRCVEKAKGSQDIQACVDILR